MARAQAVACAVTAGAALLLSTSTVRAEASSWLSMAGGAARLDGGGRTSSLHVISPLSVGVGTTPAWPVQIGMGTRLTPFYGEGVEWSAYLRASTQGYVVGGFGLALDAGGFSRAFDGGSTGLVGALHLGVPWGGVVSLTYARGSDDVQTVGATFGVDLLRLTVYRLAGEQQWANPLPAYRP